MAIITSHIPYERPEKSPGSGEEFAQHLRDTLTPEPSPAANVVVSSNKELGYAPHDPSKLGQVPVKRFLNG